MRGTCVMHGNKDIIVIPINAFLLEQRLPDAQLLMFPDASHASHSQYAELFLDDARRFVNG